MAKCVVRFVASKTSQTAGGRGAAGHDGVYDLVRPHRIVGGHFLHGFLPLPDQFAGELQPRAIFVHGDGPMPASQDTAFTVDAMEQGSGLTAANKCHRVASRSPVMRHDNLDRSLARVASDIAALDLDCIDAAMAVSQSLRTEE